MFTFFSIRSQSLSIRLQSFSRGLQSSFDPAYVFETPNTNIPHECEPNEPMYIPVPDPDRKFKPTINRVSLPDRYQVSDEHLAIPGVLEITQYNMHAYLFANDESQKEIHHHNLYAAKLDLHDKLREKYQIDKGTMTIYYSSIINYDNCEVHKLAQPKRILYNLDESNIKNTICKSITPIIVCCDKESSKIIKISLGKSWHPGSIEWEFELVLKE